MTAVFGACLVLSRRANKWDHLGFLLRLIQEFSNSSLRRQEIIAEPRRWDSAYNQSQTALTTAQSVRIAALLSAAGATMPDPLAQAVAFALRTARRS